MVAENASLPKETKSVAGVLSGQWSEQSWNMKYRKLRFFFGKGIVEELLAQLRIEKVRFRPVEGEGYAFLQPGRAAEVLSGGTVLGWVGEIHPEAREAMGIDEVVVAFELDLNKLIKAPATRRTIASSRSTRLLSMTLPLWSTTP